jgi:malonyl-CoA O-methyltransferase
MSNFLVKAFSQAARHYDEHAVLQREIGTRLVERLDYIRHEPKVIVDAGCGTGHFTHLLAKRFRRATVTGFDLAEGMIEAARKRRRWWSKTRFEVADMTHLPLPDNSVDFLFSNLALQWVDDLDGCFREWQRVLKPRGLLLFSTFGPDTLKELRQAWKSVDDDPHVNTFPDMHDVGDALLRARLAEPVMDAEFITTTYRDVRQLLQELKAIGANHVSGRNAGRLVSPGAMKRMMQHYESFRTTDGWIPATWEVVYGHGWGSDATPAPRTEGDTFILDASLRRP